MKVFSKTLLACCLLIAKVALADFNGYADSTSWYQFTGWACESTTPTSYVQIDVYRSDGPYIGGELANQHSDDTVVAGICGNNAFHRYAFNRKIAARYRDGNTYSVYVYGDSHLLSPTPVGSLTFPVPSVNTTYSTFYDAYVGYNSCVSPNCQLTGSPSNGADVNFSGLNQTNSSNFTNWNPQYTFSSPVSLWSAGRQQVGISFDLSVTALSGQGYIHPGLRFCQIGSSNTKCITLTALAAIVDTTKIISGPFAEDCLLGACGYAFYAASIGDNNDVIKTYAGTLCTSSSCANQTMEVRYDYYQFAKILQEVYCLGGGPYCTDTRPFSSYSTAPEDWALQNYHINFEIPPGSDSSDVIHASVSNIAVKLYD